MPVTQLPTPPSKNDSLNFAARADALFTALPTMVNEINALELATNAKTAANEAASQAAALAAATARDAAVAAWSASTAPAEQLASISRSVHFGAIVKAIIDDTSRHTDGGAWRKRCQDKSWYSEALGGDRWVGQQASIAAAWTAAGSAVGAVFQATATAGPLTAGKYYAATSSTTATEVFRGITRERPAASLVVFEAFRVVFYDLTQPTCPMWMVWAGGAGFGTNALNFDQSTGSNPTISGGAVFNEWLLVSQNGAGNGQGLRLFNFVTETIDRTSDISRDSTWRLRSNFASRNTAATAFKQSSATLASLIANDVAVTVLDTAPTDPATGLPVPTIAVATSAGISVIRDDGVVVNITGQGNPVTKVGFIAGKIISGYQYMDEVGIFDIPATSNTITTVARKYYPKTVPTDPTAPKQIGNGSAAFETMANKSTFASGTLVGLGLLKENPSAYQKGMVAYITNAYNSGWMVGDIRGAFLADTVAETITGSGELVTNGTFTTDTSGWTSSSTGTSSIAWDASGAIALVGTGTGQAIARTTISTVIGRTYIFSITSASGGVDFGVGTSAGASDYSTANVGVGVTLVKTFVASTTTAYIQINGPVAAATKTADNISVKLADPDRSVKSTGLVLNGTLTKTAVASGAGLAAYSGFSASNYLEQPYSVNLDFGTGDFCVMGWLNAPNDGKVLLERNLLSQLGLGVGATKVNALYWYTQATAQLVVETNGNVNATVVTYPTSGFFFAALYRRSGTLYMSVNGVETSLGTSADNLTNTSHVLRIGTGIRVNSAGIVGSMALWRIGATAPSADQIAHIYRTELPLFQPGAQCTLAGTSASVTALAYDDVADVLHAGTSWGRSAFRDLLRVDSEATTVGAITSLSAIEGVVLTGGASSAKAYAPAYYLRDELRRKDVERKALGRVPAIFDYTATASQTAFVVPKGFTAKALYKAGVLMRETTTGVYWTRSNDGFTETATLSVGATVGDWVSIMCVRS